MLKDRRFCGGFYISLIVIKYNCGMELPGKYKYKLRLRDPRKIKFVNKVLKM